jgi:hypothetical protein
LDHPDRRYQDPPVPGSPSAPYNSQWAEVAYFLRPVPDATGNQDNAAGTPLYALYRRQLLAVPADAVNRVPLPNTADYRVPYANVYDPATGNNLYLEVSAKQDPDDPNYLRFNSPLDLTMPPRRFGMLPVANNLSYAAGLFNAGNTYLTMAQENVNNNKGAVNTAYSAADLLLTDVLSFDVRVLVDSDPAYDFRDLFDLTTDPGAALNKLWFPVNNPAFAGNNGPRVFDTWTNAVQGKLPGYDYTYWKTVDPNDKANGPFKLIPIYQGRMIAPPTPPQTAPQPVDVFIRIKAIQVTIRVWDFKTKQARQITIVQDL